MRQALRSRLGLGIALGVLLAGAVGPSAYASQARQPRSSVDQDPWSVTSTTSGSVTWHSPKYASTTGRVKACITTMALTGTDNPTWRFKLVWHHGRVNTVVWRSRRYTAARAHCSPVRMPTRRRDPKFFVRVTLYGGIGDSADGISDIYHDF